MKTLSMLALACSAAAVLAIFAAPASATQLTSPQGTVYTGTVQATSTNIKWDGAFTTIECGHSEWHGSVESHGAAVTTKFNLSKLTFTGCNFVYTVKKAGSLEIHTDNSAVNDGNGTLTWTGAEISAATSVGTCIFTTSATDIGTITGSDSVNAVLDINSAKIPRTGGNFLCGSSATLTGNYTITTPSTLTVD
jgi:hypothetical protein